MNTLLLAVIVMVGVVLLLALAKSQGGSREYPYHLSKYLLSKAERSFYGVLVQAVGSSGIVFSKVRVADAIVPNKGLNRSSWQRAFNAVSSKHFDFIVCDPADCSIKLAVELDDSSHESARAQKRDGFLNGACQSAGLPLLRIKVAKAYVVADLRRQVTEAISPQPEVRQELAAPVGVETPDSAEGPDTARVPQAAMEPALSTQGTQSRPESHSARPQARVCPKCGESMLLRKAKSGANVGQAFWGCSAFPKCRTVVQASA